MSRKKESEFWHDVLKPEIERRMPDCVAIKQDPNTSFQGVPDYLVICSTGWAALETKRGPNGEVQPNQEFYIEKFNEMSFAAFIDPTNMDEVLDAMEESLGRSG